MSVVESSLPGVLRERQFSAQRQRSHLTDYERSWDGVEETLTRSQLYRRTLNPPHSQENMVDRRSGINSGATKLLDYVVSFIASLWPELSRFRFDFRWCLRRAQFGLPCSPIPHRRVPTASSVVDTNVEYVQPQPGQNAPAVIEVDR